MPETKAVPIECMESLFAGGMRHRAWRSKKLFPPQGIPPLPAHLVAGQEAYIRAHQRYPEGEMKAEADEFKEVA